MSAPVLEGAEPASYAGGRHGVLVIHGFTGSPQSMRPLADAIAAAGFTVELPLLPGHGTAIEDLLPLGWSDWSDAVESVYRDLASRSDRVGVVGLSMGGALAVWLAVHHPEIGGLVAINAAVEPGGADLVRAGRELLAAGTDVLPGIGSDIARPDVTEQAYAGFPVAAMITTVEAVDELAPLVSGITCPALVFSSTQDHVVPPSAGAWLASTVSGPVETVTLERSFHVATLDYDAELIESRTVEFLTKTLGA
jgi:carboxylesterase